jgi:hypothetical protein
MPDHRLLVIGHRSRRPEAEPLRGTLQGRHAVIALRAIYCMASPAGLEPATLGLEIPCSVHLSYGDPVRGKNER